MRALLINPWIYDFAAYDLWLRPLGLLRAASCLRAAGWEVHLIDCLDRFHPLLPDYPKRGARRDPYGCGKFGKTEVEKPALIRKVERRWYRYGIPLEMFCRLAEKLPRPDAVLVGSTMTYWYPGCFAALRLAREMFPGAPAILGGLYPRLCPGHAARFSGADAVCADLSGLKDLAAPLGLPGLENLAPAPFVRPAFDLLTDTSALPLQTSRGCPFSCPYCASPFLQPELIQRAPEEVFSEITEMAEKYGVKDIAFYDDALLYDSPRRLAPLLKMIAGSGLKIRFHSPNGLHARFLTPETAELMKAAGFVTLRLGLESSCPRRQRDEGGKVDDLVFRQALDCLERAGFDRADIGIYILAGLPGQELKEAADSIAYVRDLGARPFFDLYSPIPGTPYYHRLEKEGVIEPEMDPLWHNNTIFYLRYRAFNPGDVRRLRRPSSSSPL